MTERHVAQCFVCKREATRGERHELGRVFWLLYDCARCGEYAIDHALAKSTLASTEIPGWWKLSAHLRAEIPNEGDELRRITEALIEEVNRRPDLTLRAKVERLEQLVYRRTPHIGAVANVHGWIDCSLLSARDFSEIELMLHFLRRRGHLDFKQGGDDFDVTLTADGLMALEGLGAGPNSVFVAMWFDPRMDRAKAAIRAAIEVDNGLSEYRVEDRDSIDQITDQIIAGIHGSSIAVVDVTGARPSVYFEAGYAIAAGKSVIFSVAETSHRSDIHFDTSHYPHIVWKDPDDLRKRLAARLEATVAARRSES